MPPKKDAPKKQKPLPPMVVDDLDPKEMKEKDLLKYCLKILQEIEQNRQEKIFFQLEKEKISTYWQIAREQLSERQKELKEQNVLNDRIEELEYLEHIEKTRAERDLKYKAHTRLQAARVDSCVRRFLDRRQVSVMEMELLRDKRYLTELLVERQQIHDLRLKQMRMSHYQDLVRMRIQQENEDRDMRMRCHELLIQVRGKTERTCYNKQMQIEHIKNQDIERLLEKYDSQFKQLKDYYNDITLSNIGLIQQLKDELKIAKKELLVEGKCLSAVTREYNQLNESIYGNQAKILAANGALELLGNCHAELIKQKGYLRRHEHDLNAIKWEHQALILRNAVLAAKHEKTKAAFHTWLIEILRTAARRDVLSAQKIEVLEKETEKYEATREAIQKCGIRKCVEYRMELNATLKVKEQILEMWKDRVAKYAQLHDKVLGSGRAVMLSNKVPIDTIENPAISSEGVMCDYEEHKSGE